MLKFAFKNLLIKRVNVILIIISITLSAGVALLSFNTARQVSDGITNTAGYYSAVVGPAGSSTQLVMNTMYFAEEPLGTIPYSVVTALAQDSRVKSVIPFAMADSYNGYSCVGTTAAFLESKSLAEGTMFVDGQAGQVVVGSAVAKTCQLKVGDVIYTSHSAGVAHTTGLTVVGILEQTHTSYDTIVFTQLKTIWELHEHEGEEEHEEEEEHDHEHMENAVCAILIKTTNPATAMTLVNEYDGKTVSDADGDIFTLQAAEPMSVVRNVLEDTNSTKYIVYVLCAIILAMNILVIVIITLLNMNYSAKEIRLMRLIGVSMKKIGLLYMVENAFIGLISVVLALITSKLGAGLMTNYVQNMGVVLDRFRVYPGEWLILLGILVITVLPTMICTYVIGKRDAAA